MLRNFRPAVAHESVVIDFISRASEFCSVIPTQQRLIKHFNALAQRTNKLGINQEYIGVLLTLPGLQEEDKVDYYRMMESIEAARTSWSGYVSTLGEAEEEIRTKYILEINRRVSETRDALSGFETEQEASEFAEEVLSELESLCGEADEIAYTAIDTVKQQVDEECEQLSRQEAGLEHEDRPHAYHVPWPE